MVNFAVFKKYGEKYEEKTQVVLSEVFGSGGNSVSWAKWKKGKEVGEVEPLR